jgi:hypothetical protein
MTKKKKITKAIPKSIKTLEKMVKEMYGETNYTRILDYAFRLTIYEWELRGLHEENIYHDAPDGVTFSTKCNERRRNYLTFFYNKQKKVVPHLTENDLRKQVKEEYDYGEETERRNQ